jgi:hypothetical protein
MANNIAVNPLYLDTVGGSSFLEASGSIGSILFSGNTDTDSTVLLYNAKNRVTNRGFEIWSSGTALAPHNWVLSGADATVAREATIVHDDTYSAKLTRVNADCKIEQNILGMMPPPFNDITYWRGKVVCGGMWGYATVNTRVYVEIYDGQTTTTSSAHGGGSAWTWLAPALQTVHSAATELTLRGKVITGNTSGYFDNAALFEAIPAYSLLGQDKSLFLAYPRPMPFDGLYLQTITGGSLQVQI